MRREILKLGAGCVLCAAAWAACGGEKTVIRKELGYEISFPDSYDANDYWRSTIVSVRGPSVRTIVLSQPAKDGDGLRSLFTNPLYRDLLEGSTLTAIDIVRLSGARAIKLEMDDAGPNTHARRPIEHVLMYFAIANGQRYCIVISAQKSDFEKCRGEIDAIVASFKIIEPK